jgi:hypothetical protein
MIELGEGCYAVLKMELTCCVIFTPTLYAGPKHDSYSLPRSEPVVELDVPVIPVFIHVNNP